MKYILYPIVILIQSIFGVIDWEPPTWIRRVAAPIDSATTKILSSNRIKYSLLLALIFISIGYAWYRSLPEPHYITFIASEPLPTPLLDDAKPYPLEVTFSGAASPIEGVGKEIVKGIHVTPEIKGTWKWETDALMKFYPEKDWSVGIPYKVTFDKKLFARQVRLKDYYFNFSSPEVTASILKGEFYEDPTDPKIKQAVYTVTFTHPIDKRDFEKRISLKMRVEPQKTFDTRDVRHLTYKVLYNDKSTEAYVRSEILPVPERDGEVLIVLDRGIKSSNGGNGTSLEVKRTVQVPGIENYFKVLAVRSSVVTDEKTYEAKRILSIETTASVNQKELDKNIEVILLSNDPKFIKNTTAVEEESYDESEEGDGEGEEESEDYSSQYTDNTPKCPWKTPGEISESLLKASSPVQIKWLPADKDYSSLQTLSFDADVGRCLLVRIKKGTKSFGDFALATDKSFLVDTKPFPAEVKIMHEGSLLAISGDKRLSIMARNLEALRFKLHRILPSSVHHFVSQSWGDMPKPSFYYNIGLENLSEVFTVEQNLSHELPGRPQYTSFNFENYLRSADASVPKGLFVLDVTGWNPVGKYEVGPREIRLVLITDIGILVKDNQDTSHDIYVQSLAEGLPLTGAQVSIVGKNGVPIFTETSDALGHVHFASFKDFSREKTPTMYVVEKNGDYSFLPYAKGDRELNLSRFDVGGEYTNDYSSSLQGYLFSDRGIYRPGEEAHIGLIVKKKEWDKIPSGLPLTISIIDPRGSTIREEKISVDDIGFTEYSFPFSEQSLTGSYNVQLSVFNNKLKYNVQLGSTIIRVEEFRPDSLQIQTQLIGEEEGVRFWRSPLGIKASVQLRNLFGTPAVGHTVKGTMYVSPFITSIPGYQDYTFFNPEKKIASFNETFGEIQTDDNGDAKFDLNLTRYASTNLKVTFVAEGFEKGNGRSVSASQSVIVSKEPFLIGYKSDGDLDFIHRSSKRLVKFVSLTGDLKRSAAKDLIIDLVEKQYVSVLQKQSNGNLAYQSVEKKTVKSSSAFVVSEDNTEITLPTETPGTFVYEIKNKTGQILARMPFTVVGQANLSRSLERSTELQIKLSKDDYAPGEDIELQIQAPFTGSGLITVEQNKIYAAKWFKTDTTNSVQTISVPKELEGNGYITVTFLRSLASPEIFVSPLSYGVKPFSVNRTGRTQHITLDVPSKIKPGETLHINYKSDRPTKIALFAVDQGILQVARYKTPDPLGHFFRKRALEVSTHQILDLLLPEYKLISQLSGTGGDEDALLGRFRNPFKRPGQKPVAYWSGILNADEKPRSVSFDVPDYFNGTIRTFAVSVDAGAIGVVEKETVSQGEIVLSPTVPYFAAPGDTFEINSVVTNIASQKEDIEVSVLTDNKLSVVGDSKIIEKISQGKDAVIRFNVKVLDKDLGSSKVVFTAKGSSEAKYTVDLSIRPAQAREIQIQYGSFKGQEKAVEVNLNRDIYSEEGSKSISASTLPVSFVKGISRYLDTYPFGCSEQLASKGFDDLIYLKDPRYGVDPGKASKAIEKISLALGARQKQDGSFASWPGSAQVDPYLSVHITRFLLEAKERGALIAPQLISESTNYLRTLANGTPKDLIDARTRAYAIYLLTRKEEVTTSYIQALLAGLKDIKGWEADVTALFIASSYKMLHLDNDAQQLRKGIKFDIDPKSITEYHDSLAHKAHLLYLLSKHFQEEVGIKADFIDSITTQLQNREYSTISSSLLVLALETYLHITGDSKVEEIDIKSSLDGKYFTPVDLKGALVPEASLDISNKVIRLSSHSGSLLFYQATEDGFDKQSPASVSNGLEILREYRDNTGKIITDSKVGDDIEVRIVVRSLDNSWHSNIAITDLLPSGFELVGGTEALSQDELRAGDFVPMFVDATEDRALLFGTVTPQAQEFRYKVKAVSKGEFVIPPVQAESMYSQNLFARGSGGKFVVN